MSLDGLVDDHLKRDRDLITGSLILNVANILIHEL